MPAHANRVRLDPADETIRVGAITIHFLVTGHDSGGSVALFEVTIPAGQRLTAPAHSHDGFEETIYGVAGVSTWTVDGSTTAVGPGHALCIPRGAVHRFDNDGRQDAKVCCAISPAGLGPQFFREAADVIKAAAGGSPDRGKMAAIMIRHGLTPAAPPPSPPTRA